jgi:hypothetical protein
MPLFAQLLSGKSTIRYLPPERNGWFSYLVRQITQTASASAGQDHSQHIVLTHTKSSLSYLIFRQTPESITY